MKILQINGWCGRLNGPLVRFINDQDPDILCIQEAFDPANTVFKVFEDQYGYIKEILNNKAYRHYFFAPAWGFSMAEATFKIGNIIISKYPLKNKQQFHTHQQYAIRTVDYDTSNTRVFQSCDVVLPNDIVLSVANYQGYVSGSSSWGNDITVETLEKVCDGLAALEHPVIFCCDLNIRPDSPAMKTLDKIKLRNLTSEHKVPTTLSSVHRAPIKDRASVACDYIFVSNEIKVSSFTVSEEIVSDHKALLLEFSL